MEYQKEIRSYEPVKSIYFTGHEQIEVLLKVGEFYQVTYTKPTNKKDRNNNGRIVEVLGFNTDWCGDVIVRYKDNNRRGRLSVNCLLPISNDNIHK